MKHTRAWVALGLAAALSIVGVSSAQAADAAGTIPADAAVSSLGTASVARMAGVPGTVGTAYSASSTSSASSADARPVLIAPVRPVRVSRLFDPPPKPWNAGHRGIDLLSSPAGELRSPGSGVVVFAGYVVNRPVLSIDLDVGLRASMEPVANIVAVGHRVHKGELIGTVDDAPDAGHCEPDWCVHWGLRRGDTYFNPLDWLEGYGPVRLLPLQD